MYPRALSRSFNWKSVAAGIALGSSAFCSVRSLALVKASGQLAAREGSKADSSTRPRRSSGIGSPSSARTVGAMS